MDTGDYLQFMGGLVGGRSDRGRYNEAVQFVYSAAFGKPTAEGAEVAAEEMLDGIDVPEGLEIRGVPAGVGRGASGLGIALAIMSGAVLARGAIRALVDTATDIARLWKRLFRKHGPPMLSLGALKMLCVADLARREPSLDAVVLLHAAEVTGEIPDIDHTGHDLFLITFVRPLPGYSGEGDLWLYVVDTYGQVVHFASVRWEALYHLGLFDGAGWRSGAPPDELPPFLADFDDLESED